MSILGFRHTRLDAFSSFPCKRESRDAKKFTTGSPIKSGMTLRTPMAVLAGMTFVLLMFGAGPAHAACSSPTGAKGEIIYNDDFNLMQFCDDTNWISMAGGANVASETDPKVGTLTNTKWCTTDGSVINCTEDAPGGTPSGIAGSVQFSDGSAFASDNANLFWDDTNKRLGIGTAAPGTKLHISSATGGAQSRIESTETGGTAAYLSFKNTAQDWYTGIDSTEAFAIYDITGGSTRPFSIAPGADSNALHIDANGNVGIGTAAPGRKLDVAGAMRVQSGDTGITGSVTTSWLSLNGDPAGFGTGPSLVLRGAGSSGDIDIYNGVARNAQFLANGNATFLNNVGIGTVSPGERLDVNGNILADEKVYVTGSSRKWYLKADSGSDVAHLGARISSDSADLDILTYNTSGNVGIGISNPTSGKLHVVGGTTNPAILGNNSGTNYGVHGFSTGTYGVMGRSGNTGYGGVLGYSQNSLVYGILGHANSYGVLGYSDVGYGSLSQSVNSHGAWGTTNVGGGVGVGGVNNASGCYGYSAYTTWGFYTNCNAYLTGTVYYGALAAISDGRLKEKVENVKTPLDKVMALHPVTFEWKEDAVQRKDNEGLQYGFIAQEVQKIIPEIVNESETAVPASAGPAVPPATLPATPPAVPMVPGTAAATATDGDAAVAPPAAIVPAQPTEAGEIVDPMKAFAKTLNAQLKTTLSVDYTSIIPVTVGAIQDLKRMFDGLVEMVTGNTDRITVLEAENAALKSALDTLKADVEALKAAQ